jgi:methyl-accepting chemotaxis protein
MTEQNVRQPVGHFFVKKSLQFKIITEILLVVFISAVITTAAVTLVYNAKSQSGSFYFMSNDFKKDLELKNILEVILPSVIGAQIITMIIGFGIGLFSSRKIAVPIYKFEKWVRQLKKGNLMTRLDFREKEEMEDLIHECNELADFYKEKFIEIDNSLKKLELTAMPDPEAQEQVNRIKQTLGTVSFN